MSESPTVLFNIFNPSCSFLAIEHILLMILMMSVIYGLPSIVAYGRNSRNLIPIIWCNLLLGWTIIVWVVTLIWAYNTGGHEHEHEFDHGHNNDYGHNHRHEYEHDYDYEDEHKTRHSSGRFRD